MHASLKVIWDSFAEQPQAILCVYSFQSLTESMQELISFSGSQTYVAINPTQATHFALERMPIQDGAKKNKLRPLYQSIDAREGITTGISVDDRVQLLRILLNPKSQPRDIVRPGHIFPCAVHAGGTLATIALPEAAYDIAQVSHTDKNISPIGIFHDLLDENGNLPSEAFIKNFALLHNLEVLSIADIIINRLKHERLVTQEAQANIPIKSGAKVTLCVFTSPVLAGEHLAVIHGEIQKGAVVPVRVQIENILQDVFCDSSESISRRAIDKSMEYFGSQGSGVFVYIRKKSSLEKDSSKNVFREYGIGAQILKSIGVQKIELLTTNISATLEGLETFGIEVVRKRSLF